jgi:tRNA threonylcarbamoyladenosine biosynthesis protein TsaB
LPERPGYPECIEDALIPTASACFSGPASSHEAALRMKMKILIIDTCGTTGSVALADTDRQPSIVASASLPGRTASERLVPAIKHLAERAAIGLQSLDAVAVVHGPGSFTGVRVGLSAAKGLSEALGLPLVAISRLAVLANLVGPPPATRVYALLDAGRGEFYSGIYANGACLSEALLTRNELLAEFDPSASQTVGPAHIQARIVVACEPSVAQSLAALAPQLVAEPIAQDALPLALRRIQQRDFDDPATLDANYLRRTDAEIFAKPTPPQPPTDQTGTPAR